MTAPSSPPTIAWKLQALDADIASVRYRAVLPSLGLLARGVESRFYDDAEEVPLAGLLALVFVKSFTTADLRLAERAVAEGVPVILDLCDNIFVEGYVSGQHAAPAALFGAMARVASAVVTTGPVLQGAIAACIGDAVPIVIVPDGLETEETVGRAHALMRASRWRASGARVRALMRLGQVWSSPRTAHLNDKGKVRWVLQQAARTALAAARDLKRGWVASRRAAPPPAAQAPHRIMWFGNHGAPHADYGLSDVLLVADALTALSATCDFELLVVSNHREKFERLIRPLPFKTAYAAWSAEGMPALLRSSHAVIVPNSRDAFSYGKSANRTLHALQHGVPVVATATPALAPLEGAIVLDDWLEGLRGYMTRPELVRAHLEKADAVIQEVFSLEAIAEGWAAALAAARTARPAAPRPRLVVGLNLPQDLDLGLPIARAAQRAGVPLAIVVSEALVKASPRAWREVAASRIPYTVLQSAEDGRALLAEMEPGGSVLSVSETTLRPHAFSHRLAQLADARGQRTYTLQHGFENIGLTYTDAVQPIQDVAFASERILLWGDLATLHPEVSAATRARCVPSGCPKPARVDTPSIPSLEGRGPVVGIFENLHWHRYSADYARRFLEDVLAIAAAFPATTFLVKPHHAGKWLTSRYEGDRPAAANLIIADPADPAWEGFTAPQLFGRLDGVITSPSTVALDAARAGLPTAVVGYDMLLENYMPLPVLGTTADWHAFVAALGAPAERVRLVAAGEAFCRRVLLPGDGAAAAVTHMVSAPVGAPLKGP